ncbi:MAG TPA: RIP metalloprotease RseP [bacterium]|nr:RIP metalloprotease RseP [bacterium]
MKLDEGMRPAPIEPVPKESPWWQTGLFLALATVLIVREPTWAAGIAALGLLVFIHEFGHFLVALSQGMRVESFSLGFGPALVKFTFKGTVYQIAAIPLGGFVKPAGEDPKTDEDIANAKPDEFMGRPWWSRILVALAGPAMNLAFPLVALFLAYALVGRQNPWGPPMVQAVFAKSGAAEAGLKPGDLVLKVDGLQVNGSRQLAGLVDRQSRLHLGTPLKVMLMRGQKPLTLKVATHLTASQGRYLMGVSVAPGPEPFGTALASVGILTPAEKAGFKKGDQILSVDGQALKDGYAFSALFAKSAHDPVPVQVSRGAQTLTLLAAKKQPVPDEFDPAQVGLLGLEFVPAEGGGPRLERLEPVEAGKAALEDTVNTAAVIVLGVVEMVRGKISAKDNLGGPVAILRMASQVAEHGWQDLLNLMCQLSLTLGLMNLLPVPVLDGGTIVTCLIEGLRRKPLRLKTQIAIQNVGVALIGSLFIFITANDLWRWMGH